MMAASDLLPIDRPGDYPDKSGVRFFVAFQGPTSVNETPDGVEAPIYLLMFSLIFLDLGVQCQFCCHPVRLVRT